MNSYEEELQKSIEAGQNPKGDELDVKAYREVFQALKQTPGYEVSPGFADRVMLKAEQMRKKDSSRDMFWFGTGIFLIVIALIVAIVLTGFKPSAGFLNNMSDYKGLVIFGVAFITFLNWVDKRLIRNKHVNV
jgi:hypothetical protein